MSCIWDVFVNQGTYVVMSLSYELYMGSVCSPGSCFKHQMSATITYSTSCVHRPISLSLSFSS